MSQVGYHASHEQFPPSDLLRLLKRAERAGFEAALNSDHFHPWSEAQGQSGFAWAWMGAALATTSLTLGSVTAPGQRYHPAIVAQALATLGEMFPDRAWMALGSGQALNEGITGEKWSSKEERNARLLECVEVMRALFRGETVSHRGRVVVEEARLYTRPARPPLLVGAALTPATARWVASWADGLITVSQPPAELARIVEAFREGGGERKPMFLKVQLSFDKDEATALSGAREQWATNVFPSAVSTDLRSPRHFADLSASVSAEWLAQRVRISSDSGRHLAWLAEDLKLGFSRLYLHNVNREQERFIDTFGARVVPELRRLGSS